ncbi:MAG: type 4a pilus biogenesis protein PilO [Phycisphaerae bacterium]|nr:type 4a pilus biogenesis protein PilO [Phycisphaerae bacterium]
MKFGIREILFLGLLLAIPVVSYYWVFKPAAENRIELQSKIQANQKKVAELHKAKATLDNLNTEVDELAEAVGFFESKLPAKDEIYKVLEQVTKIARKQNLDTRLFKTLKVKPLAQYSEQPIEMEVYGNFDAYYQFLIEIEKLHRITKIQKMELIKDGTNEGNMSAKFILSIFFDTSDSNA